MTSYNSICSFRFHHTLFYTRTSGFIRFFFIEYSSVPRLVIFFNLYGTPFYWCWSNFSLVYFFHLWFGRYWCLNPKTTILLILPRKRVEFSGIHDSLCLLQLMVPFASGILLLVSTSVTRYVSHYHVSTSRTFTTERTFTHADICIDTHHHITST